MLSSEDLRSSKELRESLDFILKINDGINVANNKIEPEANVCKYMITNLGKNLLGDTGGFLIEKQGNLAKSKRDKLLEKTKEKSDGKIGNIDALQRDVKDLKIRADDYLIQNNLLGIRTSFLNEDTVDLSNRNLIAIISDIETTIDATSSMIKKNGPQKYRYVALQMSILELYKKIINFVLFTPKEILKKWIPDINDYIDKEEKAGNAEYADDKKKLLNTLHTSFIDDNNMKKIIQKKMSQIPPTIDRNNQTHIEQTSPLVEYFYQTRIEQLPSIELNENSYNSSSLNMFAKSCVKGGLTRKEVSDGIIYLISNLRSVGRKEDAINLLLELIRLQYSSQHRGEGLIQSINVYLLHSTPKEKLFFSTSKSILGSEAVDQLKVKNLTEIEMIQFMDGLLNIATRLNDNQANSLTIGKASVMGNLINTTLNKFFRDEVNEYKKIVTTNESALEESAKELKIALVNMEILKEKLNVRVQNIEEISLNGKNKLHQAEIFLNEQKDLLKETNADIDTAEKSLVTYFSGNHVEKSLDMLNDVQTQLKTITDVNNEMNLQIQKVDMNINVGIDIKEDLNAIMQDASANQESLEAGIVKIATVMNELENELHNKDKIIDNLGIDKKVYEGKILEQESLIKVNINKLKIMEIDKYTDADEIENLKKSILDEKKTLNKLKENESNLIAKISSHRNIISDLRTDVSNLSSANSGLIELNHQQLEDNAKLQKETKVIKDHLNLMQETVESATKNTDELTKKTLKESTFRLLKENIIGKIDEYLRRPDHTTNPLARIVHGRAGRVRADTLKKLLQIPDEREFVDTLEKFFRGTLKNIKYDNNDTKALKYKEHSLVSYILEGFRLTLIEENKNEHVFTPSLCTSICNDLGILDKMMQQNGTLLASTADSAREQMYKIAHNPTILNVNIQRNAHAVKKINDININKISQNTRLSNDKK